MQSSTNLLAREIQLHADHQPHAAHFLDERIAPRKFRQPHPEITADIRDVRQQPVKYVEELEPHAAHQRPAAEGGSVLALDQAQPPRFSFAATTPSGSPQATGFAAVITSGITGGSSNW